MRCGSGSVEMVSDSHSIVDCVDNCYCYCLGLVAFADTECSDESYYFCSDDTDSSLVAAGSHYSAVETATVATEANWA